MSPTAKIAGVAAVAGLMLTVAVVSTSKPASLPMASPAIARGAPNDPLTVDMRRCRTITIPDSGCEAAWEAKRRRFFGKGEP